MDALSKTAVFICSLRLMQDHRVNYIIFNLSVNERIYLSYIFAEFIVFYRFTFLRTDIRFLQDNLF